jgi:hypothetical protein
MGRNSLEGKWKEFFTQHILVYHNELSKAGTQTMKLSSIYGRSLSLVVFHKSCFSTFPLTPITKRSDTGASDSGPCSTSRKKKPAKCYSGNTGKQMAAVKDSRREISSTASGCTGFVNVFHDLVLQWFRAPNCIVGRENKENVFSRLYRNQSRFHNEM